jgi:hypothetical protein
MAKFRYRANRLVTRFRREIGGLGRFFPNRRARRHASARIAFE